MGADKKKLSIIGLSSILLVAAVVAAVGITRKNNQDGSDGPSADGDIQTSNKAIKALCQPTDYKQTCVDSLSGAGNSTDPKELIKTGFNVAVKDLQEAINNSTTLQEAEKDPRTSNALSTCKVLLNTSIDDLKRSFDKVSDFDMSKMDEYINTLKVWLSGAITYQQTCIDGFENTTGDASEKMKKVLKTAGQITSNGLAMLSEISTIIAEMQIPGVSRRLFSTEDESSTNEDGTPEWVDPVRRSILVANVKDLKPSATVSQDGSGQFKTIQEAVNKIPLKNAQPFVVLIKAGIYKEYVQIPRHVNNVVFVGEGAEKTKITGNKNFADGVGTYQTATVAVNGDNFVARDIGFENSAGPEKHQAVALRVSGDMAIFYNCRMDAYQDTLYTHSYRQYYRDCTITGTIDFIFGDAAVIFQNCRMEVRKPGPNQNCMVTAQGRKDHRSVGGTVLQNCTITGEPVVPKGQAPPFKSYLGRPWKEFSRTIIMNSFIDSNIDPEGWAVWNGNFALDTLYYSEFMNRGPGSDQSKRVAWRGIQKISPQQAETFTGGKFFLGDDWVKASGIPYEPGMINA
ncbi:hypothetical protein LguiA_001059 [Lonicera macranthoides]